MKKLKILLALAGLVCCYGCTQDGPVVPTVVASPSPTPPPDPKVSCDQADLKLVALNGAGNADITFGVNEPINVVATPTNGSGFAIPASCNYSRVAGWSVAGPTCAQFGDQTGLSAVFFCAESGDLSITATNGGFKAFLRLRVIR